MSKKMLIDATHNEETRVAITDGNKLVEYDYESQSRKPLKGSIFLAKVTRVEPSLQAAFVNFGGNRHGFLPFSEIHPDYFKIPVADREALMAEQEALLQEHDEEEEALDEDVGESVTDVGGEAEIVGGAEIEDDEEDDDDLDIDNSDILPEDIDDVEMEAEEEKAKKTSNNKNKKGKEEVAESESPEEEKSSEDDADGNKRGGRYRKHRGRGKKRSQFRNRSVEVVGGEEIDEQQRFRFNLRRKYKIQEVVKRGQIMLIQVNKEERGNKGAAVGSYLSLPGRYCVLMPNSPRAGGVSRKIANHKDRARMRDIVKSLEVPKGMSVIVRTAGVTRTKTEIKRDLDYLMRLWNTIRELTLQSTAPAMVYEEADLIKRAVRDLYSRDVEEIHVAGDEGFKTAKEFMKMMIPSHVKKVKQYEGGQLPLFNRYQIESQINEIGQPEVRLRSGGYLVINPTEALVSIDVNSGKATKGRHIEETALKTNLEAADEVARQLRLRDLGGLVVIDFIDMEDRRNNAKVERRMKEALSTDRARVQVGRISSFGLMELSRQRLSPSLTEAQFEKCCNCNGIGLVRTDDAMSIIVLRAIEDEGILGRASELIVQVTGSVALYLLNYKRKKLAQIEERYNLQVLLRVDDQIAASDYRVEVSKPVKGDDELDGEEPKAEAETEDEDTKSDEKNKSGKRRGRRGGRGRGRSDSDDGADSQENADKADTKSGTREKAKPADKSQSKAPDESSSKKEDKNTKSKSPRGKAPSKKKDEAANDDAVKEKEKQKETSDKPVSSIKAAEEKAAEAKKYEVVNQAPEEKKKGWWNRLVE